MPPKKNPIPKYPAELLIELQEVIAGENFGRRFADSLRLGLRVQDFRN